ncbi:MAG: hypothetical protein RL653_1032 [Pseudomonadota bacterium]|jgi:hypothetical protein
MQAKHGTLEQHAALAEQAPHIRPGAPLRCDGPGRLESAEDIRTGTPMAVRWIPLEAKGAEAVAAAAQLPRHPALPTVRLTGTAGGHAWAAIDYPEGRLLAARLQDGFSLEWVALVGEAVAEALAALHARGLVHGEFSAESVLLHGKHVVAWDVPLVVMGRICERRGDIRIMSRLQALAPYMPPERLLGGPATPEGDIYGLGVLVTLMLGAPAPSAESSLGLVHQVATGTWRPGVPPGAPSSLRALLHRMICEVPEARPSALEVVAALRQAVPPPTRTEPEMPAIVLGGLPGQGGVSIQVPSHASAGAVATGPASFSAPFLAPRTVSGNVPVLPAAVPAAPRPAQDVAAGMTLPLEARPMQDVAVGYALPVRARAEAEVLPLPLPEAAPEAAAPEAPRDEAVAAAPAVTLPSPERPAAVPRWFWPAAAVGVLLGLGVAWLAVQARSAGREAAPAVDALLEAVPLVDGETAEAAGRGEQPGMDDGLEAEPLVRRKRKQRRTTAAQSISDAFGGNEADEREAAAAESGAEEPGAAAESEAATAPASSEQLRRPNF